jgi:hypothetical protein
MNLRALTFMLLLPLAACGADRALQLARDDAGPDGGADAGSGCVCPMVGNPELALPADAAGAVMGVSTHGCAVNFDSKRNVIIAGGSSGSQPVCQISVTLSDNRVLVAQADFVYVGKDCGWRATGGGVSFVDASSPSAPSNCNCPNITVATIPLPTAAGGRVVDVTGDHCAPSYTTTTNSLYLAQAQAASCTVVVSLTDGTALSTVASFDNLGACCGFANVLQTTPFTPVPTGAPACSR